MDVDSNIIIIISYPIVIISSIYILHWGWIESGISARTNFTPHEMCFQLSSLATLPFGIAILLVSLAKAFASSNSWVHKVFSDNLKSTSEQTFVFIVSLLAAASWDKLPNERFMMVALVFIVVRLLYTFSCVIQSLLGLKYLKTIPHFVTLANSAILFGYNLYTFLITVEKNKV